MPTVLSLFSGGLAGLCERGIQLAGLSDSYKVKQFVEIDEYRQKLLNQNFPGIPIYSDVTTYEPEYKQFDIIVGGSPCQDSSRANTRTRTGLKGDRSGLWWEQLRIINTVRPSICLWENPAGCRYPTADSQLSPLGSVLWSLNQSGYFCQWESITVSELGGPQQRERVFVIASNTLNSTLYKRSLQSPWSRQVRETIERFRDYSYWASITPELTLMDHGFSTKQHDPLLKVFNISGWWNENPFTGSFDSPARSIKNRSEQIAMIGDACTPQQAAVCWDYISKIYF